MNLCSGPGVGGSLGLDPAESDEAGKGRRADGTGMTLALRRSRRPCPLSDCSWKASPPVASASAKAFSTQAKSGPWFAFSLSA